MSVCYIISVFFIAQFYFLLYFLPCPYSKFQHTLRSQVENANTFPKVYLVKDTPIPDIPSPSDTCADSKGRGMICWWCGLCSGKIISVAKYDCLYSRSNDVLAHACRKGSLEIKGAMFGGFAKPHTWLPFYCRSFHARNRSRCLFFLFYRKQYTAV